MQKIVKGDTPTVVFLLTDATDNETAETGLSATASVTISKDGGSFAAVTNSVAEIGSGWYKVALTATETNTAGPLIIEASDTGTNTWRWVYLVEENIPTQISDATAADVDALMNEIADHVLKRAFGSAAASSDGDGGTSPAYRSLMGVIAKQANRTAMSGSTLTIYEDDDSTSFFTQTATTNASADPITELDTN